jgi:hypothetical protein
MTALAAALALATANPLSAQKSDIPAGYQGVCVTLGLDMGRMGCIEDSGCYANVDAHLRLGARLSERFGVGLGASLFGDFESDGSALYSLQALCYPFNRKLFALLGAGVASAGGDTGGGMIVELGYDLPLNSYGTFAITPHVGLVLMSLDDPAGDYV